MKHPWVVIPAYNEASFIRRVINDIQTQCPHIVVVDDASTDDTKEIAISIGVTVLEHFINRGQGAALRTGIEFALKSLEADAVVTIDADGQHDAADIPRLLAPVLSGQADVTLGSRFLPGSTAENIPAFRKTVLKAGSVFTRFFSGIKVSDPHNGLRAFSRRAATLIRIEQDRMAHASEIIDEIALHKLRYVEVPVTVHYSDYSLQKGQRSTNALRIAFDFLMSKLLR